MKTKCKEHIYIYDITVLSRCCHVLGAIALKWLPIVLTAIPIGWLSERGNSHFTNLESFHFNHFALCWTFV